MPAVALLLVACLAGCAGGAGDGSETPRGPDDLLVTKGEIAEAGAGTAEGRLLAWWRSLQFDDPRTAIDYYAPGVTGARRLAAQLDVAGAPLLATPRVQEVQIAGRRALVYAVVLSAKLNKLDQIDTLSRRPVAFHMARGERGWVLTDNEFMASRATTALSER